MTTEELAKQIENLNEKVVLLQIEVQTLKSERIEQKTLFDKLKGLYSHNCEDCKKPFKTYNSLRLVNLWEKFFHDL